MTAEKNSTIYAYVNCVLQIKLAGVVYGMVVIP